MTNEEFQEFWAKLSEDECVLLMSKGIEYSGSKDRFRNFKSIANQLDLDPVQVAWVYLEKHLDSLRTYIKERHKGYEASEPIRGRIHDARNYLALIAGLIEDKQ